MLKHHGTCVPKQHDDAGDLLNSNTGQGLSRPNAEQLTKDQTLLRQTAEGSQLAVPVTSKGRTSTALAMARPADRCGRKCGSLTPPAELEELHQ
jgi:hypothetical protein